MSKVLFLLGHFGVGGVERVTVVLAQEFVRRGYGVMICAFKIDDWSLLERLDPRIVVKELGDGWMNAANRAKFREFVIEREIGIVINQWAVPYPVTRFIRKSTKGLGIKLIAVHHNLPTANKRIQDAKNPFVRLAWKVLTSASLRLVYEFSDRYVVLSESFVPVFTRITGLLRGRKLLAIPNPLTLDVVSRPKENVVLYVGRLEETQKRVSRVLDIWRRLADLLPDWRLEIVGDGPDRQQYEKQAMSMPRVLFKGFQNPAEYYARAKILLLTSDFEGFPLVLCEAMASRCVPIVLGSYSAAYDIIDGGNEGGRVLPIPFDADQFAHEIELLSHDPKRLTLAADAAEKVAEKYDVGKIVDRWTALFGEI